MISTQTRQGMPPPPGSSWPLSQQSMSQHAPPPPPQIQASGFLPTIRCSSCGQQLEISSVADHLCQPQQQIPAQFQRPRGLSRPGPPSAIDIPPPNHKFHNAMPSTPTSVRSAPIAPPPRSPLRPPTRSGTATAPPTTSNHRHVRSMSPEMVLPQETAFPLFPTPKVIAAEKAKAEKARERSSSRRSSLKSSKSRPTSPNGGSRSRNHSVAPSTASGPGNANFDKGRSMSLNGARRPDLADLTRSDVPPLPHHANLGSVPPSPMFPLSPAMSGFQSPNLPHSRTQSPAPENFQNHARINPYSDAAASLPRAASAAGFHTPKMHEEETVPPVPAHFPPRSSSAHGHRAPMSSGPLTPQNDSRHPEQGLGLSLQHSQAGTHELPEAPTNPYAQPMSVPAIPPLPSNNSGPRSPPTQFHRPFLQTQPQIETQQHQSPQSLGQIHPALRHEAMNHNNIVPLARPADHASDSDSTSIRSGSSRHHRSGTSSAHGSPPTSASSISVVDENETRNMQTPKQKIGINDEPSRPIMNELKMNGNNDNNAAPIRPPTRSFSRPNYAQNNFSSAQDANVGSRDGQMQQGPLQNLTQPPLPPAPQMPLPALPQQFQAQQQPQQQFSPNRPGPAPSFNNAPMHSSQRPAPMNPGPQMRPGQMNTQSQRRVPPPMNLQTNGLPQARSGAYPQSAVDPRPPRIFSPAPNLAPILSPGLPPARQGIPPPMMSPRMPPGPGRQHPHPPTVSGPGSSRPPLQRSTTAASTSKDKGLCRGCSLPITGKSVSSADGQLTGRYHKPCFVCKTCKSPFPTNDFYVIKNQPYCAKHYHELNGSTCKGCEKGIEGVYVSVMLDTAASDGKWKAVDCKYHRHCFCCKECRLILKGEFFDVDGMIYCAQHAARFMQNGQGGYPGSNGHLGIPHSGLGPRRFPERRTTRLMMT